MNKRNLAEVMNHILENPETWDQSQWHCGSSHCFAGWAQIFSGEEEDSNTAPYDAQKWLEINDDDSDWLFGAQRQLRELHAFVDGVVNHDSEFDLDGFDQHGFSRSGYDIKGYDREGKKPSPIQLPS